MKRRWHRIILMASTVLLATVLVVVGLVVWFYKSGRLATLSQTLLQRLSGQEVTIDTIEFPSWDTIAFTNVRLQQGFPGWHLTVECPRLEAHYGLAGLLNKRVDYLRLQQPRVELSHSDDTSLPPPSSPPAGLQSAAVLPLNRLILQQGTLQVRWDNQIYTLQQLDATLQSQGDHQLQAEVSGSLEGSTATLQAVAHITLGKLQPTGRLHVTATTVPVSLLAEIVSQTLPRRWKVAQGALDIDADLNFQEGTMQGKVITTVGQVTAQAQNMAIHQATFSTETAIEADFAQRILRLEGQARLRAERASRAPDMVMTKVSLSTEATMKADFAQQTLYSEGQVHLQAARASKASDIVITDISLSTEATMKADFAQQALRLEGQARFRAERASKAPDITITKVSLTTPWRLSHAPARWQITATPALQSHTAEIGTLVRASRLSFSTNTPVQIQHGARGLQVQGAPELAVQTIHIHAGEQTEPTLRITDLRGRLPLRGNPALVEITGARVHTQAWHRQMTDQTELLKTLSLQGSGSVDLRRQRLAVRDITVVLPQLGSISGSGAWHWPSHTLHDPQVQLASTPVDVLQNRLKDFMPAAYRAWQIAGQTELHLRATRLSLRSPRRLQNLVFAWQMHDGAFSSPDSVYAGEHLNGTLQATASFDEAAGQYTLQGTLTLHPFALLVGSVFPAIEENHITSVVAFSGAYSSAAERLKVYLAGQFRNLGMLTLQGVVHRPIGKPQYDMQLHLRDLRLTRFWKTFMSDTVRFPVLSQAKVQGRLNAAMRLRGRPTNFRLRGTLDVTDGHFHTGTVALRGVSLVLPIQVTYPLPHTAPQITTLPPEAYGGLSIDAVRIGNVEVEHLHIGLTLRSDNILFQRGVHVPLWGGQIALEHITARHMLQPHRRVALRARLRNLDLQRLPRGTTRLPLAGIINGDFPRFQIRGDQLETQGSLTIEVAGGVIRIFDVQGSELFSALPTLRCSLTTEQPLSLLRLTEIYPIGDIGGTMRFSVTDLVITAGEPAAFSLEFAVQKKGGETREITLRALNNLLFTAGSANVTSGLLGDTYRLPYKRFGANVTLRNDTLRLRGKYYDREGNEYFMRAPTLGGGVSIVNRVPENGIPFRDFLQRLKATVLEKPEVQVK